MEVRQNVYLLLMMAGKGTRFGADVPKQFTLINGKEPIFIYLLKELKRVKNIDDIIVLTNPDYLDDTVKWIHDYKIKKVDTILPGGEGRSLDILKGLNEINSKGAKDDDIVLIYDATHPIVDVEGCEKVIEALYEHDAVTLAEYQYDTTYKIDKETNLIVDTINREEIIAGASPEGFKFKLIYDTFTNFTEEELRAGTSAGAVMLRNKVDMLAVRMSVVNLKITYSADYDNFIKLVKGRK